MGDKNPILYEILAYCLYRKYPIQRFFILLGVGANGKGCFMRIMRNVLGKDNFAASSLEMLSNPSQRFEKTKLHLKLLVQIGETNTAILKYTSILKQLTGGDAIPGEQKGKNPYSFENYAKMIIAANDLPLVVDKTNGFYRRSDLDRKPCI